MEDLRIEKEEEVQGTSKKKRTSCARAPPHDKTFVISFERGSSASNQKFKFSLFDTG